MVMSSFDPKVEARVKWGFTEEEIMKRFDVYMEWDTLHRMFGEGGKSGSSKFGKSNVPKQKHNQMAIEKILDNIL